MDAALGAAPVMAQEDLFVHIQRLRAYAVNKKLDMTDAFEEYCAAGYDKNMGVMDTQRFTSVMGMLFGGELSSAVLRAICFYYGTGGTIMGGQDYAQTKWKQFAIDFDNVPLAEEDPIVDAPELTYALQKMRAHAVQKRLDLTDAFEEYSGTLQEKNTGIMTKNRFRSTMGTLFRGNLEAEVLNALCAQYGTGDPDPREAGTFRFVRWKQFAIDFDNVAPLPPPPLPDPTPEIVDAMRAMNEYCNLNGIDLAWDFEEYMGGKDKCTSDLMTRQKFCGALGVLLGRATSLYQLDKQLLDDICTAYAAGDVEARTAPGYGGGKLQYTHVQWREFALDVNRIQSQPYLEGLSGPTRDWSSGVVTYPQLGQVGEAYPELGEGDKSPIRPVYGTAPPACTASFGTMPSSMANNAAGAQRNYGRNSVAFGGGTKSAALPSGGGGAAGGAAAAGGGAKVATSRSTARSASASTRAAGA